MTILVCLVAMILLVMLVPVVIGAIPYLLFGAAIVYFPIPTLVIGGLFLVWSICMGRGESRTVKNTYIRKEN